MEICIAKNGKKNIKSVVNGKKIQRRGTCIYLSTYSFTCLFIDLFTYLIINLFIHVGQYLFIFIVIMKRQSRQIRKI